MKFGSQHALRPLPLIEELHFLVLSSLFLSWPPSSPFSALYFLLPLMLLSPF